DGRGARPGREISRRCLSCGPGERTIGAWQGQRRPAQDGARPPGRPSAGRVVPRRRAVRRRNGSDRGRAEGRLMQYSQALLDDIRAADDIVDLVGRFVNLRKAGSHWKGLCPFHSEKTPSFTVNPQKGIFHCFGCGVGGDAFGFVMRQDRLSLPEAVRALAKSTGIALPDEPGARSGDSGREELIRVMELAGRFYTDTLWKPAGERARAYLGQRGIDAEIARQFGLGDAPEGWRPLLT